MSTHCIETLLAQHGEYNRTKDPSLRLVNNVYIHYMRKMKVIRTFESSDEFVLMQQRQQELIIRPRYENCQRQQPSKVQIDSPYCTIFVNQSSSLVKRLKFKNVTTSAQNVVNLTLCHEYHVYLTSDDIHDIDDEDDEDDTEENDNAANVIPKIFDIIWPSFIWSLLKDESMHKHYGRFIWRFVTHN